MANPCDCDLCRDLRAAVIDSVRSSTRLFDALGEQAVVGAAFNSGVFLATLLPKLPPETRRAVALHIRDVARGLAAKRPTTREVRDA